MPFLSLLLFYARYFWLLVMLYSVVQHVFLKIRAKKYIKQDPTLKAGYDKLIWGILIYTNIPWAVIGAGVLLGQLNTTFDAFAGFTPQAPFPLLFYGTMVMLSLLVFVWVWFRGGAEFLARHRGMLNTPDQSPVVVKIVAAIGIAVSVVFLIACLFLFPPIKLR